MEDGGEARGLGLWFGIWDLEVCTVSEEFLGSGYRCGE